MTPASVSPISPQDSTRLKNLLRQVFDSQIPNYGDYNLVCARRSPLSDTDRDVAGPEYYVVGYRWQPLEIMMAPFEAGEMSPAGTPVELNMTNLAHAVELAPDHYETATSTGAIFYFEVPTTIDLPLLDSVRTLVQSEDYEDFTAFMTQFVTVD
ncbi:hypothetical protein [Arthrobacter roseus]|uniref:hypothetical protein n=1 Tax=Arthrobacter roseus TaxID=136274 RepID=UPI0019641F4B|nr:hypothetical protein [Arthrobacter roseus]MBM7848942.1 hypothetical protein [Arthrobacter roseus]